MCLAPSGLAGTTGTLIGDVVTADGAPVTGAGVAAVSPSGGSTTSTDPLGHFSFVSLSPDTYTVTVSHEGYTTETRTGVTVTADNVVALRIQVMRAVPRLGTVVISATRGIVSPGTVPDVYSINAHQQNTYAALGGGGDLDFAYSALTSVPGAFVPPAGTGVSGTGWNQPIFIRGGAFDEVGYELDGVPVNRSFDNILTTNLSTLGQSEVQVYSGGQPADAESHGLSGYVNQVIKRGTFPGFANISMGIGSPALYNKLSVEVGGATPDLGFSYYIAGGTFTQDYRYIDQSNGASQTATAGMPFDIAGAPCLGPDPSVSAACYSNRAFFNALPAGPGGYILGPYVMGKNGNIFDREGIVNLHFAIPYKGGKEKDEVQLLYDTSGLFTGTYSSAADWGGPAFYGNDAAQGGILHSFFGFPIFPVFVTGFQYDGGLGQPLSGAPGGPVAGVNPYFFPGSSYAIPNQPIPALQRDLSTNGLSIFKVQYQHDFGSYAYVRIYGYGLYSNYLVGSPNGTQQAFISTPSDRELWTHTRGLAVNYVAQVNRSHLFTLEAAYTTAKTLAFDNGQSLDGQPSPQGIYSMLVNAASPNSGTCFYEAFGFPVPASCEPLTAFIFEQGTGLPCPVPGFAIGMSFTCNFQTPPAGFEWLALENGASGPTNSVTPKFSSLSVEDQWRASARLNLNLGVRYDGFRFDLAPTAGGPTRATWFNAWNTVMCANPLANGGNPIDETLPPPLGPGLAPGTPCSALGAGWVNATLTNSTANGSSVSYNEFEPRAGGTYTLGDEDVIRFSYGRYAEPPGAQLEEIDTRQANLPAFMGSLWFKLGYTTPEHDVRPSVSNNADLSWEHRFHGTDIAFKVTPFYRVTHDQVQQFFIDPTTGTLSGINAGRQTASGVEFLLSGGDPAKDGWSGQLSFTYTHSRIRYDKLPNGTTLLSGVNASIQLYNSYTSACVGAVPSIDPTSMCGISGGANAMASELSGIANPYFNAPAQPLLDPSGSYPTYFVVPTGLQLSSASYGVPDFATLHLTYKRDRLSVTPIFQYIAGPRYGAPQQQIGVDPASCTRSLVGPIAGDQRYPFGGTGTPYDATSCVNTIFIPDQFTGKFDAPGAFTEPSFMAAHLQLAYQLSSRTTVQLTLANLYVRCFGGDQEAWTMTGGATCGYDVIPGHVPPVGNIFNPGDPIQRFVQFPYGNLFSKEPLNAFVSVSVKL